MYHVNTQGVGELMVNVQEYRSYRNIEVIYKYKSYDPCGWLGIKISTQSLTSITASGTTL